MDYSNLTAGAMLRHFREVRRKSRADVAFDARGLGYSLSERQIMRAEGEGDGNPAPMAPVAEAVMHALGVSSREQAEYRAGLRRAAAGGGAP